MRNTWSNPPKAIVRLLNAYPEPTPLEIYGSFLPRAAVIPVERKNPMQTLPRAALSDVGNLDAPCRAIKYIANCRIDFLIELWLWI